MCLPRLLAAFVGLVLAAGPAVAIEDELPYEQEAALVRAHKAAENVAGGSFDTAVAHYPTKNSEGDHAVKVGRYLMFKLIALFESREPIELMRLDRFALQCERPDPDNAFIMCDVTAVVLLEKDGEAEALSATWQAQAGRHFEPGPDYAPAIHAQLAKTIDLVVMDFAQQLDNAGLR